MSSTSQPAARARIGGFPLQAVVSLLCALFERAWEKEERQPGSVDGLGVFVSCSGEIGNAAIIWKEEDGRDERRGNRR